MSVKSLLKWVLPTGIIEHRRRRLRLSRLGLPNTGRAVAAVDICHYDLWPLFLRAGSAPWTLVDVGANQGEFIGAAELLGPVKKVYAFEPLPACSAELTSLLSRNLDSKLFRAAVGAESGEISINFTGDAKMSSVLAPDPGVSSAYQPGDFEIRERVKVPLVSLDDTLPDGEEFGLLKIDAQGFELEVLRGAKFVLKRTRAVMMEANYIQHYQGGISCEETFAWMRDFGFRLTGVSAPYMSAAGPLWADALFVR